MKYFVYVLKSEKFGRTYTGLSSNLENRLDEHNAGRSSSTKPYKPWKMVYFEECENRIDARKREKYLKSGSGREFLRKVLDP